MAIRAAPLRARLSGGALDRTPLAASLLHVTRVRAMPAQVGRVHAKPYRSRRHRPARCALLNFRWLREREIPRGNHRKYRRELRPGVSSHTASMFLSPVFLRCGRFHSGEERIASRIARCRAACRENAVRLLREQRIQAHPGPNLANFAGNFSSGRASNAAEAAYILS